MNKWMNADRRKEAPELYGRSHRDEVIITICGQLVSNENSLSMDSGGSRRWTEPGEEHPSSPHGRRQL